MNSRSSIEVTNLEQITGRGVYEKLLLPRSVFEVLYKAPTKLHDDLFTDISLLYSIENEIQQNVCETHGFEPPILLLMDCCPPSILSHLLYCFFLITLPLVNKNTYGLF